jgi:solute carrier family 25 (mitochondrial adenine nucleotide translocator), member 4/5/6/31
LQVQRLSTAPPLLQYRGLVDAVRRLPTLQGGAALWRGNGANVLRAVPSGAIKLTLFERTRDLLTNVSGAPAALWSHRLAAGAIAGGASLVVLYPLDCGRTLVAADWAPRGQPRLCAGVLPWLRASVADAGLLSLFRGFGLSVLGALPYQALVFAAYDTLKQRLPAAGHGHAGSTGPRLAAAASAAVLAQTLTYPLDTVRRRLQVNGRPGYQRRYRGTVDAVVQSLRRDGARSLFAGVGPNALRAVSGTALQLVLYDYAKELLVPR